MKILYIANIRMLTEKAHGIQIMKTCEAFVRLSKKIFRGEDIFQIKQGEHHWDNQFRDGKWDFLLTDQSNTTLIAKICLEISQKKNISILDAGCGNGALGVELSRLKGGYDYCGIDFSKEALEKARKVFPQGHFIYSDVAVPLSLPKKFDVIVFSEVLYYVDFKKVLMLYKDFLKNDGVYIISIYNTWRAKFIFFYIRLYFKCLSRFKIKTKNRKQSWVIKVCQFKN